MQEARRATGFCGATYELQRDRMRARPTRQAPMGLGRPKRAVRDHVRIDPSGPGAAAARAGEGRCSLPVLSVLLHVGALHVGV
eukprot:scaffold56312_cov29-Tisochrysis_lutea.AAC.5